MRRGSSWIGGAAFAAALWSAPAPAQAPLQQRVEARLALAGAGVHFGLVVAGEDGREIVAVAPEGRFVPASTTKMFTVAAAFALLPGLDAPDAAAGASVRLDPAPNGASDVLLTGHGDARLSSAADCREDCLATLADAVAAKTRKVRDVIGDDGFFPDERWSPGMSWNNIPTRSGTATSALTLDDNELALVATPGAPGKPPVVAMPAYFTLSNEAVTVAAGAAALDFDRLPGSRILRLTGTMKAGAPPETLQLGIDDPADYAAWRFKTLLEARGVRVAGRALARHRPLQPAADPAARNGAGPAHPPEPGALASLSPAPLIRDLTLTAKVSQNLHAALLLRRLGRQSGSGSIADGVAAVRRLLDAAGVPKAQADFADGSGMSTYNRVAPRGAVAFLRWAERQPWGAAWRATLPVGGVDGTLARRFRDGGLKGRVFAKTGTLNQVSALAGYMVAKSGRTLVFAAFANDIPDGAPAVAAIDAALELVAAEN